MGLKLNKIIFIITVFYLSSSNSLAQSFSNKNEVEIILNKNISSIRDKILNKANKEKLMLRPAWKLMHRLPHLKKFPRMDVANSVSLEKRLINLPSSIY